jgi:hypothetical protein
LEDGDNSQFGGDEEDWTNDIGLGDNFAIEVE